MVILFELFSRLLHKHCSATWAFFNFVKFGKVRKKTLKIPYVVAKVKMMNRTETCKLEIDELREIALWRHERPPSISRQNSNAKIVDSFSQDEGHVQIKAF